jgi:nucleoside-diphosphate-sugar epimerase
VTTVFVTGGTGYLGSYVCDTLLREHDVRLALLVRAEDRAAAEAKLFRAWQLHMDARRFRVELGRVDFYLGDVTLPRLGLDDGAWARAAGAESIVHIAASLNRRSEKACLNTNVRGTLEVVKLGRAAAERGKLRRFSHVSTTAVCGKREGEVVGEDGSIDWERSDYDPYGRTKKLCEHLVRELLPGVPLTIFRPSTVLGDARFPETTQFDMVRAFCVLADLPVVPMSADTRQDIANADWVGRGIATLHMKERPRHDLYHLSSGVRSKTAGELTEALASAGLGRSPRFAPWLRGGFERLVSGAAGLRQRNGVQLIGSLLKVFLPYVTNDVVFDGTRAAEELGGPPVPVTEYCAELYRWSKRVGFRYPYVALPARVEAARIEERVEAG